MQGTGVGVESGHDADGQGQFLFDVTDGQSEADIRRPRLAGHAAAALAAEWGKGGYDRIVISAGPKLLGALRKAMPEALQPHIGAELHKDLVKLSVRDLPDHLKDAGRV